MFKSAITPLAWEAVKIAEFLILRAEPGRPMSAKNHVSRGDERDLWSGGIRQRRNLTAKSWCVFRNPRTNLCSSALHGAWHRQSARTASLEPRPWNAFPLCLRNCFLEERLLGAADAPHPRSVRTRERFCQTCLSPRGRSPRQEVP